MISIQNQNRLSDDFGGYKSKPAGAWHSGGHGQNTAAVVYNLLRLSPVAYTLGAARGQFPPTKYFGQGTEAL